MFRSMRRAKQQLPAQECIAILQQQPRGVLAIHGEDGYPYALPMNHWYEDGKLYFHGAKVGHKIDALQADARVSFCVMDEGYRAQGDWALNIKSVIVFGKMRKVEDAQTACEMMRKLGMKHYPSAQSVEQEMRESMHHVQILALTIDHMTGKLVKES